MLEMLKEDILEAATQYCQQHIIADDNRIYHNIDHINSMIDWSEMLQLDNNSYIEMYELCLGILFHDLIYDSQDEKEIRSAKTFKNWSIVYDIESSIVNNVYEKILATEDHSFRDNPLHTRDIIRLDLADLSVISKTRENYLKIYTESILLYNNISQKEFYEKNIKFMETLRETCQDNKMRDHAKYKCFWDDVIVGINETIRISTGLIKEL